MTGSSASANTQPIQVNTLSSQITRHGDMTIVNSPKGVTMAWEAPANMDIFVPLGTLVKAPAAAAKGMRAAKTVDAAADTTKAADVVSDVAKAPEPKGPNGNGGKIKATPKMKPHTPKCFKPGKALKKRFKNNPKKLEKEFYKQLSTCKNRNNKYIKNKAAIWPP